MEKVRRICACVVIILLVDIAAFCAGYFACKKLLEGSYRDDVTKYESGLAELESINSELQAENKRITELNQSVTERLASAASILDGMSSDAGTDADTIRRLIKNLSILEQAISVIFEKGIDTE